MLESRKIPRHSVMTLMANERKWREYIKLSETNPSSVMMIHKDEYCEYDPHSLLNVGLAYHGYWDANMIDHQAVLWFPLGVRKIFPRILPEEITLSSQRRYLFNLIVSLSTSSSRKELADIARSLEYPSFIHTISKWNRDFKGYIGPQEYKERLLESTFTLSPRSVVSCFLFFSNIGEADS